MSREGRRAAVRYTILYLVAAFAWIIIGDQVLEHRVGAHENSSLNVTSFQTLKGGLFVLLTGIGLFVLFHRALHRESQLQRTMRLLLENANDLIFRYRLQPDRGFEYVSPACLAITGYTQEEYYADPGLGDRLIHPDDRGLLKNLEDNLERPVVLRWIRKDGSIVFTEQVSHGVRDADGALVAIEGVARDVSERIQQSYELHEKEMRFHVAVSNFPDPFLIYDGSRRIIFANAARENLSETVIEDLLYQRDEELYGMENVQDYVILLEDALRSRSIHEAGVTVTWNDRRHRLHTRVVPIIERAPERRVRELLVILRDMTEMEIMQAQLDQAGRMATLGELAASVVHEINQPLSVIKMAANLLANEERPSPEFVKERTEKITNSVRRLEYFTMHLRQFGRVDTQQLKSMDLGECVRSSILLVAERMHSHAITVRNTLPERTFFVHGDPFRLEQVFVNILLNAHDAIEDSEVSRREIIVSGGIQAGGFIAVRIFNSGPPITPEVHRRLFEPFFTTKTEGRGMGLGLSISFRIVQAHGGTIRALEQDEGATFIVSLPQILDTGGT